MALGKEDGGDATDRHDRFGSPGEGTASHRGGADAPPAESSRQESPLDIDYTGPAIERPPEVDERLAALEEESRDQHVELMRDA